MVAVYSARISSIRYLWLNDSMNGFCLEALARLKSKVLIDSCRFAKQTSRHPPNIPRRSEPDDYLPRHVFGASRAIGLRCTTRCSSAGSCTSLWTLPQRKESIDTPLFIIEPHQALTLVEEFVAEKAAAQSNLVRRTDMPAIAIRIDRVHLRAMPDDFMWPSRAKLNNSDGH